MQSAQIAFFFAGSAGLLIIAALALVALLFDGNGALFRAPRRRRDRRRARAVNVSTRRVGGLRFLKIGRLCVSLCVTRDYRPL